MNRFCEILNQNLVPWFDDSGKLFVYFDNTIPTDPEIQSKTLQTLTSSKILTINEARNIMGYPSLEKEEVLEENVNEEEVAEEVVEEPIKE